MCSPKIVALHVNVYSFESSRVKTDNVQVVTSFSVREGLNPLKTSWTCVIRKTLESLSTSKSTLVKRECFKIPDLSPSSTSHLRLN